MLAHLSLPVGLVFALVPGLVAPFAVLALCAARQDTDGVRAARSVLAHLGRTLLILLVGVVAAYLLAPRLPTVVSLMVQLGIVILGLYLLLAVPAVNAWLTYRDGEWRYPMGRMRRRVNPGPVVPMRNRVQASR